MSLKGTVFKNKNYKGPGTKWIAEEKALGLRVYGKTEAEAIRKLEEKKANTVGLVKKAPKTVTELLDRYLEAGCPNTRKGDTAAEGYTAYRHDWAIDKLKSAYTGGRPFGALRLDTLTPDDIDGALKYLAGNTSTSRSIRTRPAKPLKRSTIGKVLTTLRMAFQWAEKKRYVKDNVVLRASLPHDPKKGRGEKPKGYLSLEDAKRFADILRESGDAFYYVMLRTGARFGEVAGLAVDDALQGRIFIHRSAKKKYEREDFEEDGEMLYRYKTSVEVADTVKTAASRRTQNLQQDVVDVLQRHLEAEARRIAAERARGEVPLVFVNSAGGLLDNANSNRRLHKLCQAHELYVVGQDGKTLLDEDGNPRTPTHHDLRRTQATHAKRKGAPRAEISRLLGHKDERVLDSVYLIHDEVEPTSAAVKYDWLS